MNRVAYIQRQQVVMMQSNVESAICGSMASVMV